MGVRGLLRITSCLLLLAFAFPGTTSAQGTPSTNLPIPQDARIVNEVTTDRGLRILRLRQFYGVSEIPVFGSDSIIALRGDTVVRAKSNFRDRQAFRGRVSLDDASAKIHVAALYNLSEEEERQIESNGLLFYPKDTDNYVLAYELVLPRLVTMVGENQILTRPTVYLNAETGEILGTTENLRHADVSGTVSGTIHPDFTLVPPVSVAFPDQWVTANSSLGTTGTNGNYLISGLAGSVSLSAQLQGPWVSVTNFQQGRAQHTAVVSVPGVHSWNWANDDQSYHDEESNVFYHMNIIHDYIASPPRNVTEMNYQMGAVVNDPTITCKAHYDPIGRRLNFTIGGNGPLICEPLSLDRSIIQHEYGHGINDAIVPLSWPYSGTIANLDEGFADYWACTVSNDPCVGKFSVSGCGTRCDTTAKFPDNVLPDPHLGGQIISGAFWDLREVLGASFSDILAVNTLRLAPTTFSEVLENALIANDTDGTPTNGTPNIDQICGAFWDNHHVFVSACGNHTQTGVALITSPLANQVNTVNGGVISIEGSAFGTAASPLSNYFIEFASEAAPNVWRTDGVTITGGPVREGVLGHWNVSSIADGKYQLRLRVLYGTQQQISYPVSIIVDKFLRSGWPVHLGDRVPSSPTIGNINSDSTKEVLIATTNRMFALQAGGALVNDWQYLPGVRSHGKAAIGDIDGNGDVEVVFSGHSLVKAVHHNGAHLWTYTVPGEGLQVRSASPTLADLNADGKLETIFGSTAGTLYVIDHRGVVLWSKTTPGAIIAAPAVGDLNNNGTLQIVFPSYNSATKDFRLHLLTSSGSYLISPVVLALAATDPDVAFNGSLYGSSPALADIDNDGALEIILGLPDGSIGVWEQNGVQRWRYTTSAGRQARSPAIGDLDRNGDLEIAVTVYDKLYVFHHDGTLVAGFPITISPTFASPSFYNLGGDARLEIALPGANKIHIYSLNGSEMYPNSFLTRETVNGSSVTFGDLDNNGMVDLLVGSEDEFLYAWEIPVVPVALVPEWGEFRQNQRNTGVHPGLESGLVPEISSSFPPSGYVEPLEDRDGVDGNPAYGTEQVTITFSVPVSQPGGGAVESTDFVIQCLTNRNGVEAPAVDAETGLVPTVSTSTEVAPGVYQLVLSRRICLGAWTRISAPDVVGSTSGEQISSSNNGIVLGFLPMDLTQDGIVRGDDLTRWFALRNGDVPVPSPLTLLHFLDQKRNSQLAGEDILRAIQLIEGVGTRYPWGGYDIGPSP